MHKPSIKLLYLLLFITTLSAQDHQYVSYNNSWLNMWPFIKTPEGKFNKKVNLPGWVGEIPRDLQLLIYMLSCGMQKNCISIHNRLIIHGPPGNGKTMLARNLASSNGYSFAEYKGSVLVNKFIGSGAQAVEEIFKNAIYDAEMTGKTTVIFIDEVEQIAMHSSTEFRSEHDAALRTLWLNLDKYKDDSRIFFVCATNDFHKLHATFIDRFGNNIIELKNPDTQMRKDVVEHYFKLFDVELDPLLLNKVSKKTKNLSIRSLEDMVRFTKIRADLDNDGVVLEAYIWQEVNALKKRNSKLAKFYKSITTGEWSTINHLLSSTDSLVSLTLKVGAGVGACLTYFYFNNKIGSSTASK